MGSVWVACDSQPLSPLLMRLPVAAGPSGRFTKGSRRSHVGLSLVAHLQLHELPATRCGVLCFAGCADGDTSGGKELAWGRLRCVAELME